MPSDTTDIITSDFNLGWAKRTHQLRVPAARCTFEFVYSSELVPPVGWAPAIRPAGFSNSLFPKPQVRRLLQFGPLSRIPKNPQHLFQPFIKLLNSLRCQFFPVIAGLSLSHMMVLILAPCLFLLILLNQPLF